MKKIILGLIFNVSVAFCSTLIVDNTVLFGMFNCEGFSFGSTYSTIQSAVNNANNNDIIKICNGDYNEQVAIDGVDNLTITNGADATSLSDVNWYSSGDTLTIDGNTKKLTVENISIKSTANSSNYRGIHINSAKNKITLQNLIINTPNGATGIHGEYGVDNNLKGVFKNLIINSSASGIYINKGDKQDFEDINITLTGNNANDKGLYLGDSVADKNHIFKNLQFSLHTQPALLLSSGGKMAFDNIKIFADDYSINTNAIDLGWGTDTKDLSFKDVSISLNAGTGISIKKGKNITTQDINISGTTGYAFFVDSSVTDNLIFTDINFSTSGNYALLIKSGKNVTINGADLSGSDGNGWGIFLDWGVVGDYDFQNINLSAHAGGIDIKKGNQVTFDSVKVQSDSASSNDDGVKFDNGNFSAMNFTNCDINATGNGLKIAGSTDLTVDSSKLTTRGNHAIEINTNVIKMNLKSSCFYNESSGGNSYAIYLNNWQNDININNNCLYAPNGGNYAGDSATHDWDRNYWNNVTDTNGDGKISHVDTIKISTNIVDNTPTMSCQNSCGGIVSPSIPITDYRLDECSWSGASGEVKDSIGSNNATAMNGANTETNTSAGGGICHVGKFDGSNGYIDAGNVLNPNSSNWSVSVWVKWDGSSGERIIYNKENLYEAKIQNGYFQYAWQPHWNWDGGTSIPIAQNEWTHFVVTYDHNKQKVYKNGTMVYSRNQTGDIGTNNNKLLIGARGDTNPHNFFGGDIDEVEFYDKALDVSTVNNIYNNEKDKKNYDGSVRECSCISGTFDCWDTFRGDADNNGVIDDKNISTKIVNQDFNLTIASLDENGTNYKEFNGTVCAKIDDNISKLDFRDQNESNATFIVKRAIKDIRVHLSWKRDVDENCPLSNEDNSTDSTDNFAIRPKEFNMDTNTTTYYAGVPFHIDINATDFTDGNSQDYNETNETNGSSFSFDINDSNSTCSAGVLGNLPKPFSFGDGNISFDTNYSDVGDVNFTIHEINGSEFALIDADDTNDSQRLIKKYSKIITVKPYQFAIVDYNFTRYPDQDWRYMSDVNDLNISISFKIQAQNAEGDATEKFSSGCYAHNVGFDINFTKTTTDGNISYFREANNTIMGGHDINLSDINWSGSVNDSNFTEGNSSMIVYALNVYRERNRARNPLDINVSDINTSYPIDTNVTNIGLTPDNNGSHFYYGRVKTHDISTNEQDINNTIDIDVYDTLGDNYVNGFWQDTLNWYIMERDNNRTINDLNDSNRFDNITDTNLTTTIQGYQNGTLIFDINNSAEIRDAYIHVVDMPRYLWYSRYQDFNRSGDCSTHPCFQYHYIHNGDSNGIHSGDYNGSDIGNDYNATKVKRGVKVFR